MRLPTQPGRRVRPDSTVYYDARLQLTAREAWSWCELPLWPYAFRSAADRVAAGWQATLSLAALRTGPFHLKATVEPESVRGWAERRDRQARRSGIPAPGWGDFLLRQQQAMASRQPSAKHVYLGSRLGVRRLRLPAEVDRWSAKAEERLDLLAQGGLQASRLTAEQMGRLRTHPWWAGLPVPPDTATGRTSWGRNVVVDELADIEATLLPRCVRVDTAHGTRWHATLVLSAFPTEMLFPDVEPWLAWADSLPFPVEYDLRGDLVPATRAKRDVGRKLALARDQRKDAARADHDLPVEVLAVTELAREVEYTIPSRRLPLVYGWARLRISTDNPADLPGMFETVRSHYAGLGGTGIDVVWPAGQAQLDLLREAAPAAPVRSSSYRQRWQLEYAACSLPQSASGAGDTVGDYRGYATGRYRQAVRWDPHRAFTMLNQPAGFGLVGNSGSGKSTALQSIVYGATQTGITTVVIDPSGPLARLASMKDLAGRVGVVNLLAAGGGIADPLGPFLLPFPPVRLDRTSDAELDAAQAQRRSRVLTERRWLCREVLHGLAWAEMQDRGMRAALLEAIETVSTGPDPSTAKVVDWLKHGSPDARLLARTLGFQLSSPDADFLVGDHGIPLELSAGRTAVFVMPGISLPKAGVPRAEWLPAQQLGSVAFTLVAWMARRLLWDLPYDTLKLLAIDEAYVALEDPAGRRVIQSGLLDGRKRGCAVGLSVPHAGFLLDDAEIANAMSSKFLFRTEASGAIDRLIEFGGLENTPQVRGQIRSLRDGECVAVVPNSAGDGDVRDRMQWDVTSHPQLAAITDTTPTGEAVWSGAF